MQEVNILGTTYTIEYKNEDEDDILQTAFGYTDGTIKLIVIANIKETESTCKDLKYFQRKVLRHEVIHAFLNESGLMNNASETQNWAKNEEMIDWIAMQYPKIHKVFEKLSIEE